MTCSFYVAGENIGAARLKNKMAGINLLEGDFHMRLSEFADPSPYTLSTENAANFLKCLEGIWSNDELHQRLATVTVRFQGRQSHRRAPIVAFATAQCIGFPRSRASPNR